MIVKVNLRKREEGGFINPVREKWDRRFGIAALIGLAAIFVYLLVWVCTDYSTWNCDSGFYR